MLVIVYLSYLQSKSQIHRLLEKCDSDSSPPSSSAAVLSVSTEIIMTVLQMGRARDKGSLLRYDFAHIVSAPKLSSAYHH